jgi:hypothetical protein
MFVAAISASSVVVISDEFTSFVSNNCLNSATLRIHESVDMLLFEYIFLFGWLVGC